MDVGDEQVAMMQAVTGASASDCVQYLRATNGDVDAACELFFAAGPSTTEPQAEEAPRRRPSPPGERHDDIGTITPQVVSTLAAGGGGDWSTPMYGSVAQANATTGRQPPRQAYNFASEMMDADAQVRAAQAQLARLGGGVAFAAPVGVAPGRDFGALDQLYAPPSYAVKGSLRDACARAAKDNRWVIVNVLGEDFQSGCLNRDVWASDAVTQLVDCYFILWQAAPGEEATQVAANYKLQSRGFHAPHIFIVNPHTRAFVRDMPVAKIKSVEKDGSGMRPFKPDFLVDTLWRFFEDNGLPNAAMLSARQTPPPAAPATPPVQPVQPVQLVHEVVDDDDDSDAQLAAALAASAAVVQPPPPPPEVDLDALCVPAGTEGSLRLRIKLASGPWDVVLPKTTSVQQFAEGIRTKLRKAGVDSTSAAGSLSLLVGFPPRKVYDDAAGGAPMTQSLGELQGLRSGDVVTPHF